MRAAPSRWLDQPALPLQIGYSTYLPRKGSSWLYLAAWLTHYLRNIVGRDVRATTPENLCGEALRWALVGRRRGNCYDNAELFWRHRKAELRAGESFPGLAEARLEISPHIASYNAKRHRSVPAYHSPHYFKNTPHLCPA